MIGRLLHVAGLFAVTGAFAQSVPQPLLVITPLALNEYQLTVTNGVSFANYELYHTPVLADPTGYPWIWLQSGTLGQTNFFYTNSVLHQNFFQVAVGLDWDGDGVANWLDADPSDTNTLVLDIFIDSPVHGTIFN